jgi:hypothetical protein
MRVSNGMGIAALVDFDPFDDTMDSVAFSKSILHLLENKYTTAFGSTVPISGSIKRFTLA